MACRRYYKFVFLLITAIVSIYGYGFDSPDEYSFTRIDINQGLSHNQVHCIYKDSQGFIWVGTNSGLNRFDGYTFKIFKHIPSDSASLTDNRIQRIFEDNNGKLWISLMPSYIIYDPANEKFSSDNELFHKNIEVPTSSITRILKDNSGNIWFICDQPGVYRYSAATDSVIHLKYRTDDSTSISSNPIASIITDSRGYIWVLGFYGILEKVDPETFKVIYRSRFLQDLSDESRDFNLYIDQDDDLWIYSGSSDEGLYLFNGKRKEFTHFHQNSQRYKLNNDIVNCVVQDEKGLMWVGTDHGGINIIDKKDMSIRVLLNNPDDSRSISQNSITTLYKDNEGIIWAGTFKKGLCYYHSNLYKFRLYQHQPNNPKSLPFNDVNCFQEDEKGNLWIGTNGAGLIYFDRRNNTFNSFKYDPSDPNSLSHDVIVCMLYDSNKELWLGTYYGGLNRYDGERFYHYRNDPSNPNSLSNDRVWEIFEDSRKNLWVGTLGGGIDLFNSKRELFRHFNSGDSNSIQSDYILQITEDTQGNIWIAMANGVDFYQRKNHQFIHYSHDPADNNSLSHNVVSSILVDSRQLIWMATQEGISIFEPDIRKFYRYFTTDGLPDNTILALQEDNRGDVWASTTSAITNIHVANYENGNRPKLKFTNYNESDGLQGKEFNEGLAFKTSRGELIFGGPDGFNIIDPSDLNFNKQPPDVVITNFQIYNKNVEIGQKINGRTILEKSILQTKEIVLKHYEDIISIEFAALNFIHPEKNKYEYMLEGFNRHWMKAGSDERKVTYTNLDPGEYIFRVRASNNDNIWNAKGISLKIIVKPPFWKTKTAIFSYFVLLFFALLTLRYLVLLKERTRVRNEHEKQEALHRHELDMLKIRFFTNISHEFRTPLSLIISPLEKLLKQSKDQILAPQLKLMYRNARRLLNLVNQLLDFRRMEVQKIQIKPAYGDIIFFIDEIYQTFTDLAERKHIRFEFNVSHKEFFTWFDHDKLEKIVFNLLSNAFKFTPDGKSVSIDLQIEPEVKDTDDGGETNAVFDRMTLKVTDTGLGIPRENLDRIFERFFQNEMPGNVVTQGSGIGLSLTKEFIQLYNGSITVESEPGEGSCFTVILPLSAEPSGITAEIAEEPEKIAVPVLEEEHEHTVLGENRKALVLLVEDNDDFRFYLKDNLKSSYDILEAGNGTKGISAAISNLPDLIVSDVMMPETDGIELCRQLKSNKNTSHIPIILLTARMTEQKKLEGFETGADDYITKPFSFEMLVSRMNNLIEQRERIRDSFQKHLKIEPGEIGITSLDEKLIAKALKLVEENMGNPEFSVEKLSRELGMSRVHLYKKLTALTGKTPIEFIRIMRLKRAAQLLGKSQLTVSEIAYEVGFNDPRYFSRYFKTEFGVLPSQYGNTRKTN